jgi:integrase
VAFPPCCGAEAITSHIGVSPACAQRLHQQGKIPTIRDQKVQDGRIGRTPYDLVESVVRRYVVPALGRKRMRDLVLKDIEQFYAAQCKVVQPQTAKSHCYMVKLMEDYARKRGFLKTSPVADAMKELQGVRVAPVRVPTAEEARHLLEKLTERRPYHRDRSHDMLLAMVRLAIMCGLRQGETLGLTLGNVDLDLGIIHVRLSRTRHDRIKGPKSPAGVRMVAMPPQVVEAV